MNFESDSSDLSATEATMLDMFDRAYLLGYRNTAAGVWLDAFRYAWKLPDRGGLEIVLREKVVDPSLVIERDQYVGMALTVMREISSRLKRGLVNDDSGDADREQQAIARDVLKIICKQGVEVVESIENRKLTPGLKRERLEIFLDGLDDNGGELLREQLGSRADALLALLEDESDE